MEIYDELRVSIHKYSDNDIIVIFDSEGNPWFLGKHITDILNYVRSNDAITEHIKPKNIKRLKDLVKGTPYKNAQPTSLYINKAGIYSLIIKSKMEASVKFQEWISNDLLPVLENQGFYYHTSSTMKKIEKLNDTLKKYKKRTKILERNQKHPKFKKGGYIYVKRTEISGIYKIGMVKKNISSRINTYNSGNSDNVDIIYAIPVTNPEKLELCLKYLLFDYKYRNKKENYKCTLKQIKSIIIKCLGYFPEEFKTKQKGGYEDTQLISDNNITNNENNNSNDNIGENLDNNVNIGENLDNNDNLLDSPIIFQNNKFLIKYLKYKKKYLKQKIKCVL